MYLFKRNVYKRGMIAVHFLPQSKLIKLYQGNTGKFICKPLILDNKQLLSNKTDHKATQVP